MKLLIIEDQAMTRGTVIKICRKEFPFAEIAEAASGADGLTLFSEFKPEILLLDLDLPDMSGLDIIDRVLASASGAKIIVLSSATEEYPLHRCFQAQVDGYVDKNDEPAEAVIEAIKAVQEGRTYYSAAMNRARASLRSDPTAFHKILSDQEQHLLGFFGQGLSNEQIAKLHGLSPKTVSKHRENIMGKLGFSTTPALMRFAIRKGFTRSREAAAS